MKKKERFNPLSLWGIGVLLLVSLILSFIPGCEKNAQYYVNMGNSNLLSNQYAEAIQNYNQAIKMEPKNVEAYYQRAKCYKNSGDPEKALADYETVVDLAPESDYGKKASKEIEDLKSKE